MARPQTQRVSSQTRHRDWVRQILWALVVVFYLFTSIGLIVVSAITLRFGSSFFPSSAGTGEADQDAANPAITEAHRLLEQARSNVLSSIGVALGVLSLVLNSSSLAVQTLLDYRWDREAGYDELGKRKVWVCILSVINGIFCAACVALAAGFGLASHALARYTTALSSATPGYLISASVMAVLMAVAALLTVYVDIREYKRYASKLSPEEEKYEESAVELSNR